ncbi:fggy carbohydrate kinase domain-containing protein [Plakobranchus ocellatus]|uniref:Fggy carbohydrate kinase domain-containing protein n=1 Tax=Plakobranchus ocellatus TaxID=259542 RepID=A0AAV4D704_9GAST|nr:fggy carbohydrate kinase domain-containing protein [Plakobranchus ocellatus]
MAKFFIGIDVGTSSVRASVRAVSHAQILPEEVKGIGFDATYSLVVLDEDFQPLSVSLNGEQNENVIMWMDHRGKQEVQIINHTGHKVLESLGGTMSVEMQPPKLMWLKKNLPETWKKAKHFFLLPDFLSWRATNSLTRGTSPVELKCTYRASDEIQISWDETFFEQIGLEDLTYDSFFKIGRELQTPGSPCGSGISCQAARELGLVPGTPVGTSLIDARAGALGCIGCCPADLHLLPKLENRLVLIAGTSTSHFICSKKPVQIPGVWGPFYSAAIPGMWSNSGGQSSSGGLLDFVTTSHAAYADVKRKATERKIHVFEYLNEHISKMAAKLNKPVSCLTENLHIWPDFHGNRSPIADPNLCGMGIPYQDRTHAKFTCNNGSSMNYLKTPCKALFCCKCKAKVRLTTSSYSEGVVQDVEIAEELKNIMESIQAEEKEETDEGIQGTVLSAEDMHENVIHDGGNQTREIRTMNQYSRRKRLLELSLQKVSRERKQRRLSKSPEESQPHDNEPSVLNISASQLIELPVELDMSISGDDISFTDLPPLSAALKVANYIMNDCTGTPTNVREMNNIDEVVRSTAAENSGNSSTRNVSDVFHSLNVFESGEMPENDAREVLHDISAVMPFDNRVKEGARGGLKRRASEIVVEAREMAVKDAIEMERSKSVVQCGDLTARDIVAKGESENVVKVGHAPSKDIVEIGETGDVGSRDVVEIGETGDVTSRHIVEMGETGDVTLRDVVEIGETGDVTSRDVVEIGEIGDMTSRDVVEIGEIGDVSSRDVVEIGEFGDVTSRDVVEIGETGYVTSRDVVEIGEIGDVPSRDIVEIGEIGDVTSRDVVEIGEFGDVTSRDVVEIAEIGDVPSRDVVEIGGSENLLKNGDLSARAVVEIMESENAVETREIPSRDVVNAKESGLVVPLSNLVSICR